jgi:hypothetical protein
MPSALTVSYHRLDPHEVFRAGDLHVTEACLSCDGDRSQFGPADVYLRPAAPDLAAARGGTRTVPVAFHGGTKFEDLVAACHARGLEIRATLVPAPRQARMEKALKEIAACKDDTPGTIPALRTKMNVPPLKSILDLPETSREPMSRKLTETFARLTIAENDGSEVANPIDWADPAKGMLAPMKDDASLLILCGRMAERSPTTRVSVAAVMLVLCMCDRPGKVVLWAHALHVLHHRLNALIGTEQLAFAFPYGFPTEQGYHEIWLAQKGEALGLPEVDNALDHEEPWTWPQ